MDKKIIIIVIIVVVIAIIGISAFLVIQNTDQDITNITNNKTENISNNSNNKDIVFTNHKGITDENNVTVSANCQKTAYQGTYATIIWKITNNENTTIKNVESSSQSGYHKFGDIKPSQTKTYKFTMYIPTNKDLEIDFGMGDGQWPGPYWFGGFAVGYSINNETFGTVSNSMEMEIKV